MGIWKMNRFLDYPITRFLDSFILHPAPTSAHARIARMSASFLGSNLARTAIGFVTSLVIGRGLGPSQFGRWIFFTAWASALTVAFDLGLGALVTRDAARDEAEAGRLVAGAVAARLAVFAPAGVLLYAGASRIGGGPASALVSS